MADPERLREIAERASELLRSLAAFEAEREPWDEADDHTAFNMAGDAYVVAAEAWDRLLDQVAEDDTPRAAAILVVSLCDEIDRLQTALEEPVSCADYEAMSDQIAAMTEDITEYRSELKHRD